MKSFVRSLVIGASFMGVRFMGRLYGTPLIGSTFAHLSLGAAVAPLAGFYGGMGGALGAGLFTMIIMTFLHGSLSLASLALYIPGIIGGLFFVNPLGVTSLELKLSQEKESQTTSLCLIFSQENFLRMLKSFFFIACMFLFWVNPIGQQAFLYPLLWLVPLVLVVINHKSLFARALVSAFVVHAVGACWWLYTMPMAPVLWHAMMPLVVVERITQAALMVVVVKVVEKVSSLVRSYRAQARIVIQ